MEPVVSLDSLDRTDSSPESNWTEEEKRQRLEQLSYDTFQILMPTVVFVVVLLVIGLSGNLLVFFVYFKQFPPSPTRVFVLAMTACDMTINIFGLPRQIIMMRYSYRSRGVTYCRLVGPIAVFPLLMSYWLLVCVAFDRRDRICHPLSRHLNPRQATCLLMVPFTLTAVVIFPFIHLQEEGPFDTGIPGLQGLRCTFPTDYIGVNFKRAYGIMLVISYVIILKALVICYCDILLTVIKNREKFICENANQCNDQPVSPHVSSIELAPSRTRINVGLKMFAGTFSAEVKTSKDTIQCDADTNVKAGVVKELKTEKSHVYRQSLGDPKTNNKPKHWQNLVRPETNETSVIRQDYEGCSALPVFNNNNNTSGQVQNQEESEKPEAIFQKRSPPPSIRSSCFENIKEDRRELKPGTETLTISSLKQNVTRWADENISGQVQFRSEQLEQSLQPVKIRKPRTTLMMFVLTVSTLICWTPYFIVELSQMSYVGQDLSPLAINIRSLARVFPSVNSVINPFIYNFFSPRFQAECIRFLKKMKKLLFQDF